MSGSTRRIVQFASPENAEVVTESLSSPKAHDVIVRTTRSAISPGTERLIYQGKAPEQAPADPSIGALSGELSFPLRYGYAAVGVVEDVGSDVDPAWEGQRVFAFHPHASRFAASPDSLIPIPEDVRDDDAVLIPSLETAVNLVMDARLVIGERVVIFGLGIVGLLTTILMSTYPVEHLFAVDPLEKRRSRAEKEGADATFDPEAEAKALEKALGMNDRVETDSHQRDFPGADVAIEVSGTPSALDQALAVTGYDGRILVGSWYAQDRPGVKLGTRFHRSRLDISASQVSTIDPVYSGRWTKDRRMDVVCTLLSTVRPGRFISHRYTPEHAEEAYTTLCDPETDVLQPVFDYD